MEEILKSLKLEHLIAVFKKEEIGPEQVICLSDSTLHKHGITKATDRTRLRRKCLDFVKEKSNKTQTTIEKVVDELDQHRYLLRTDSSKERILKRHVQQIASSESVRALCRDLLRENIKLDTKDWVSVATKLFWKLYGDFKERSTLLQAVIVVVTVIIIVVLGYFAYKIIPSVVQMFVSTVGKDNSPVVSLSKESMNETMNSLYSNVVDFSVNDVGARFDANLLDPW